MTDGSDDYEMLGLQAGASPEEIRQAYLDLVKVWHPDRFSHDPRLQRKANDRLREINLAYERLGRSTTSPHDERGSPSSTGERAGGGSSPGGGAAGQPPFAGSAGRTSYSGSAATPDDTGRGTAASQRASAGWSPDPGWFWMVCLMVLVSILAVAIASQSSTTSTNRVVPEGRASSVQPPSAQQPAQPASSRPALSTAPPATPASPTATPSLVAVQRITRRSVYVANTGGEGVYLRRTPRLEDRMFAFPEGTKLEVTGDTLTVDGLTWVPVVAPGGLSGYVPAQWVSSQAPEQQAFHSPTPPTGQAAARPTPATAAPSAEPAAPAGPATSEPQDPPIAPPAPQEPPATRRDAFTVGSTEYEVRAIQGTPTSSGASAWRYGFSEIYFESGRVTRWYNSGNLKVR